jgi:hypothetical protein
MLDVIYEYDSILIYKITEDIEIVRLNAVILITRQDSMQIFGCQASFKLHMSPSVLTVVK